MAPLLVYWDEIRGCIGAIRLIMNYTNEKYEFKGYTMNDDNYAKWFGKDKIDLESVVDFPNLPHFIDGDIKLTQVKVILAYLGRKHNLDATTEAERLRRDLILETMSDHWHTFCKLAYPPMNATNREEIYKVGRKEFEAQVPKNLALASKFLGKNKWVVGDRLTYADFYFWEILDLHRTYISPKYLEAEPNLMAYMKRFAELPGVKEYLASPSYIPLPVHAPIAMWANTKDYKP
jgi:glutathione S-transferase